MELALGWDCTNSRDCATFLDKWGTWCRNHEDAPLALLPITADYSINGLDRKSRAMIRKAHRYYYYQVFNYNYHLNDIFHINTSTPHRQGKQMTPAYRTYPKAIGRFDELCNTHHRYVFIGGFNADGKLRAYCAMAVMSDIAILNTIIGHCDDLSEGIMNGLINYIVSYCHSRTSCKYLNYLDMHNCTEGLRAFKSSVGFIPIKATFV